MPAIYWSILILFLTSCTYCSNLQLFAGEGKAAREIVKGTIQEYRDSLVIYTPDYSRIDLVCGTMPDTSDHSVILCASAAFTGEMLEEFKHFNIGGDHVSAGVKYKGFRCGHNTGGFAFSDGKYRFLYNEYNSVLDEVAQAGGMAFGQALMIHQGQKIPTVRKSSNKNVFRALCELDGKLCVIEAVGMMKFGNFIDALHRIGVTEALYLDMGLGWNYAWWRDNFGESHEMRTFRIPYTTNWITFYND